MRPSASARTDLSLRACHQDLLLVAAEEQGSLLSEQELLSTCTAILFSGHETTANLTADTVHSFLRFPDLLQRLRDEPGLLLEFPR